MRVLVKQSLNQQDMYFPTKLNGMLLFYDAFADLLKHHVPKVFKHLHKIEEEQHVSPFWIRWLSNFNMDVLSLATAFRMMDCYLLEGYKIIYRYGIGANILRLPQVLRCTSMEQFEAYVGARRV